MKIESEKLLEKKLNLKVKQELGGISVKLLTDFFTGLPDRVIFLPEGRTAFVEVKTTNKKPRKIQKIVINKLRSLGFPVYVIDSTEGINNLIRQHKK